MRNRGYFGRVVASLPGGLVIVAGVVLVSCRAGNTRVIRGAKIGVGALVCVPLIGGGVGVGRFVVCGGRW